MKTPDSHILANKSITHDRRLDCIPEFDERSRMFLVRDQIKSTKPIVNKIWDVPVWLDQGQEGACVGFGFSHELLGDPVAVTGINDAFARALYKHIQTRDPWPGECVDYETDILTKTGWKTGHTLKVGDEILTFDIKTETTVWSAVEKIHKHDEATYRLVGNKGFQAAVTDNHKWPVRTRPSGSVLPRPFRMVSTGDFSSGDEVIRSAPCSVLPAIEKHENDFVELMAWVICEGYYRPDSRRGTGIVVTQKTHLNRVKELLARFGVAPGFLKTDGAHSWELNGDLSKKIRSAAPGRAPSMTWLLELSQSQLELFLEVCVLADGCETPHEGNRKSRRSFFQKSGEILDAWQIACALAGQPISRSGHGCGSLGNVEVWTMRRSQAAAVRKFHYSAHITGPVWCPQSAGGTFVARRHGTIFITGNSYEGTSVLSGAKVCQELGYFTSYHWATSAKEVAQALSYLGPVVIGVNWHEGMAKTTAKGFIRVTGAVRGGHCVALRGVKVSKQRDGSSFAVLGRNSWGKGWGQNGDFWITEKDLQKLVDSGGSFCVPEGRADSGQQPPTRTAARQWWRFWA